MRTVLSTLVGAGLLLGLMAPAVLANDVDEGRELFRHICHVCHQSSVPDDLAYCKRFSSSRFPPPYATDVVPVQSMFGPNLCGIVGSPAGRRLATGFQHSAGFRKRMGDIVWTEENLNRWITDTRAFIPGTYMWLKVPDPEVRRKIIAFLKTYK